MKNNIRYTFLLGFATILLVGCKTQENKSQESKDSTLVHVQMVEPIPADGCVADSSYLVDLPEDTEAASKVIEITDTEFKKLIANYSVAPRTYLKNEPAIVDFYASWCNPCRKLSPILAKLSRKYPKVTFYKLDVDNAKLVCKAYGITSIPTLFFCANGEIRSHSGLLSYSELQDRIEELLYSVEMAQR
ncbi:MAG: thioredoxin family protein [Bacteroidales bacterium]|nr:thioredoxin family protein [Bacteroidales bacterium]